MTTNRGRGARSVDFSEVRERVPLEWFFEAVLGATPKAMSGTIRFPVCPQCGPSSKHSVKVSCKDGKWKCHACPGKGDVVEAAAKHWGLSLKDAALRLVNADQEVMQSYEPPKARPALERDDSALHEVIAKLLAVSQPPTNAALAYFKGRGIGEAIVKEAVKRGLLVVLPHDPELCKKYLVDVAGRDALIASTLWREDAKAPAAAFRPLMFVSKEGKAAEFRIMRLTEPGEHKSLRYGGIHPWAWVNESQDRIMLTEGCLDLLASLAMGTKRSIIGLPGCENWRDDWFAKLKGRDVLTAFDADEAGLAATQKITPVLQKAGASKVDAYELPKDAKDINEQLILQGPHCKLDFFETQESTEPYRDATLSLPGCDQWISLQFGTLKGRHVKLTLGGPKTRNDAALERLVSTLKSGKATVSVANPR
ncbi:DNA primase (plasmid) [Methylibium petroleiphilum PM1]|uniref:DNA primase n=2 Tax=Methylibium TaxID=316612 RepID=A2SNJ4_METPP|nr:DNA primase [Methylibium petroleiphilum PM1]